MKRVALLVALFTLGCFSGGKGTGDSAVCDAWLDCLADADPAAFTAALDTYGEDGSCWDGDPERCARACAASHEDAADLYPDEPACAAGPLEPDEDPDDPYEPAVEPESGTYILGGEIRMIENTCGVEFDDSQVDIDIDIDGSEMILTSSGMEIFCTLDGTDFDCEDHEQTQAIQDGTLRYDIFHHGSWSSDTSLVLVQRVEITCTGPACGDPSECAYEYEVQAEKR